MIWIVILSSLLIINFLLLKFSCNNCETKTISKKPQLNLPDKNDLISQPTMADK